MFWRKLVIGLFDVNISIGWAGAKHGGDFNDIFISHTNSYFTLFNIGAFSQYSSVIQQAFHVPLLYAVKSCLFCKSPSLFEWVFDVILPACTGYSLKNLYKKICLQVYLS